MLRLSSGKAALVLFTGTTFFLVGAYLAKGDLNFAAILGFCAGATFTVFLATMERAVADTFSARHAEAPIDLDALHKGLDELLELITEKDGDKTIEGNAKIILESEPQELQPSHLVGTDTPLALAQLRLMLEKQLRKIAAEYEIVLDGRLIGITSLARLLLEHQLISREAYSGIKDIALVCNQAIHGMDVPEDTAKTIIRAGEEILGLLRYHAAQSTLRVAPETNQGI
jgi:hypothetical protein